LSARVPYSPNTQQMQHSSRSGSTALPRLVLAGLAASRVPVVPVAVPLSRTSRNNCRGQRIQYSTIRFCCHVRVIGGQNPNRPKTRVMRWSSAQLGGDHEPCGKTQAAGAWQTSAAAALCWYILCMCCMELAIQRSWTYDNDVNCAATCNDLCNLDHFRCLPAPQCCAAHCLALLSACTGCGLAVVVAHHQQPQTPATFTSTQQRKPSANAPHLKPLAYWGSMLHGHFCQTTMALPTRVEPGEPHKL
jgi:hypothetical protein